MIRIFGKYTGIFIPFKYTKRRTGDVAQSICSSKKALKELNWKHKYDLKKADMDIKKIL